MTKSEYGEEKATRQCWDCFKRRLVCDRTLPGCKKCTKAGKDCVGYDEQKPLQWVQPGKVTSRRRKKDGPPVVYTTSSKDTTTPHSNEFEQALALAPSPDGIPTLSAVEHAPRRRFFSAFTASTEYEWGYLDDDYEKNTLEEYASHDATAAEVIDTISSIGGREQIERAVSIGRKDKIALTARNSELSRFTRRKNKGAKKVHSEEDLLAQLERVLRVMNMCDVPNYAYLANETSEVVQAVHYCKFPSFPTLHESYLLTLQSMSGYILR
jgi:hypothetical protein